MLPVHAKLVLHHFDLHLGVGLLLKTGNVIVCLHGRWSLLCVRTGALNLVRNVFGSHSGRVSRVLRDQRLRPILCQ